MGCCHKVVYVPIRRRRRRRSGGGAAIINQSQRVGTMSGLINVPVQIPINLGDSTAISNSKNNSVSNIL